MADFYFEIFDTIENPEIIFEGSSGEMMAIGGKHKFSGKFVVVIYKETDKTDGFVITAYLSNKQLNFEKKNILWKR